MRYELWIGSLTGLDWLGGCVVEIIGGESPALIIEQGPHLSTARSSACAVRER